MSDHALICELQDLLTQKHVITSKRATEHFRTGWRSGGGDALAVIFPQSLLTLWKSLEICVKADVIIIMQAANTGLTEGSTPSGHDYDREVVVINTLAMDDLIVLGEGQQVIGLAGTTLHTLEKKLKPLSRAPHSIIGSSCLGASIVGGVANNSGGALVKRGPAYTELSLFARVTKENKLELVNHLDIELGDTPEQILTNLENRNFNLVDIKSNKQASAKDYVEKLRDVDANTPSRFNADESKLYESSGCAGKVAVFAVRLDTFEVPKLEKTFYIGTNTPQVLTKIRRDILSNFKNLPEVGEYLHRDMFEIAKSFGKDTFLSVQHLGTDKLPMLFAIKGRIDAILNKFSVLPAFLSDRLMQGVAKIFPLHLPQRMMKFHENYEHHLILKMSDEGVQEAEQYLQKLFSDSLDNGSYFVCTPTEQNAAFLHRFAAAGAAIRYQILNQNKVGEILALDIALRRNDDDWVEELPEDLSKKLVKRLYYGHFFCHVFHQDYILKKGEDVREVKEQLLTLLKNRGAKFPAEHNVGHLYEAGDSLKTFYEQLDPTNRFNPGIGKLDKFKRNCSCG